MAKMTVQDVAYEGTPEELREIIATFEAKPVDIVSEVSVGDTVRIVTLNGSPKAAAGGFSIGDICNITGRSTGTNKFEIMRDGAVGLRGYVSNHHVEKVTEAKPKLHATTLTYNGAEYTLVDRKAQPGDVVVPTENNNRYFTNGKAYGPVTAPLSLIDNEGDTLGVYNSSKGRTEANVLVYEKVAVEAPKRFPQYGDIVRVTSDHYHNGFTEGAIGVVVDADGTFSPEIKVCGKRGYARVEIVATAESRADMR